MPALLPLHSDGGFVLLVVTILLVVIAAVMLVVGFVSSSLTPIYVSIACSALAAIVLLVFSRLSKRDAVPASAGPSPLPGATPVTASAAGAGAGGAATATAVLDRPVTTEPAPPDEGVTVLPAGETEGAAGAVGAAAVAESDEATAQYAPVGADEAGDDFPIEDYDELKVSDILPLLPELDADELAEVRQREQQGKSRATVLNRIDALAANAAAPAAVTAVAGAAEAGESESTEPTEPEALGEPASEIASTDLEAAVEEQPAVSVADVEDEPVAVPGSQPVSEAEPDLTPVGAAADGAGDDDDFPIADYDDLKVSEILPLLSQLEPDEIPVVRSREQRTKARGTILNRLDQVARGGGRAQPEPAATPAPAPAKRTSAKKTTAKKATAAKSTGKKAAAPAKTSAKKAAAPAKKATRSTKK